MVTNVARARSDSRRAIGVRAVAIGSVVALLAAGCSSASPSPGSDAPASDLPSVPPSIPAAQLDREDVDAAIGQLDGWVEKAMADTGVPGVAVAVVYQDEVLYAKGFGVREVGKDDAVDTRTRFQLASVSKPVASSVIAASVGNGTIAWDDPIKKFQPTFAVSDPYVTERATLVDMLSHRSGLPDHAGDLLEDLGYDYDEVMSRMNQLPLKPFRDNYAYTNFGFSSAGVSAAEAEGTTWPELSEKAIYGPLGMEDTSSRFSDWEQASNRAFTHVLTDPDTRTWEAKYVREPDAQSPAGGASSSVDDMAKWMRMELGDGEFEGTRIVDADALHATHLSHSLSQPSGADGGRDSFYGLGFNVSTTDQGQVQLSHSGAFALGAATDVLMLPSEKLGIVVLTNGAPVGVPETIATSFSDYARHGELTVDWAPFIAQQFEMIANEGRSETDYSTPPASASPARPSQEYVGTFASSYYGPASVVLDGDDPVLKIGKDEKQSYPLRHYDGDTFAVETSGENAVGLTGVTFRVENGRAAAFTVEYLDKEGLGTFTRSGT